MRKCKPKIKIEKNKKNSTKINCNYSMSHLQLPKTLALFGRKSSGKSWLATKLQ